MSNAAKIWIGYAATLGVVIVPFAILLAASRLGFGDVVNPWGMLGFLLALLGNMALIAIWMNCWRCKAPLSLSPWGWYWPFVLWTRCPKCGVKHASRPEDVRANPRGHLRDGSV